jgi:hypothetical protein
VEYDMKASTEENIWAYEESSKQRMGGVNNFKLVIYVTHPILVRAVIAQSV